MKVKELRLMNELDLNNKSNELKKELMKLNSQIAIGTVPKSPGKVKEIKRTIAKILSINNEKTTNKKQQKGGRKKE
ncbi:50S ribosomal protein L29 [Candidatus Woesearchaeota archaeon]|nr:50S ribosomal protein L29 [Candidatus Woesearchaeota archaeon]